MTKGAEMNEAQAAIKHLQDRAERAEQTCEALRKRTLQLEWKLMDNGRADVPTGSPEGDSTESDEDTVMVLAAKLEEAVSRVQELADEVVAKDMIIESLREHMSRHQDVDAVLEGDSTRGELQSLDSEDDSEESLGPCSDEDLDDDHGQEDAVASDAMSMALLEAAFDCDIDVATRLHNSGAQLPELADLVVDLQQRQIPAEMEATAVYVIEGLRSGSPEGEGATCALLEVLHQCWDQIPRLGSTVRAVCMVSDAEFCEIETALPRTLAAVERLAHRFTAVLISRSATEDDECSNVERVGTLRHEILTFLGFVCGDICQHVQSWPHCIARLHAAGVFHAAMHVFFSFPTSSMVHVHVVSMFTGLLDYCMRAAEEGSASGSNVPALIVRECQLLDRVVQGLRQGAHMKTGQQLMRGVLLQLMNAIHSAACKSADINKLEEACACWSEQLGEQLKIERDEQQRWSRITTNGAEESPAGVSPPGPDLLGEGPEGEAAGDDLLQVFDGIDADGFGFAPRTDLLARVSALAVDDSSLRFVVGSLEKMALKIVDREDFGKVVQQWVQLHSIMRDDDRDSEREAEEGSSSGSPGSKLLSGPGSPKSPLQGACIDELDERGLADVVSGLNHEHSEKEEVQDVATEPSCDDDDEEEDDDDDILFNGAVAGAQQAPEINWSEKQSISQEELLSDASASEVAVDGAIEEPAAAAAFGGQV